MKFIPGKKYMIEGYSKPSIYVGPLNDDLVFCHDLVLQAYAKDNKITEYKEPVTHTRYVHWWKRKSGGPMEATIQMYKSVSEESCLHDLVKVEEVTYTEGS